MQDSTLLLSRTPVIELSGGLRENPVTTVRRCDDRSLRMSGDQTMQELTVSLSTQVIESSGPRKTPVTTVRQCSDRSLRASGDQTIRENDRLPVKNRNDRVIWPTKDASDNRASDNRASVQRPQSARPQSAPLRRPQSAHERRRTDATMPLLLDNGGHSALHGGSATLSRHNFREHYSPPSFFSRSKSDLMPSNPTLGRALGSSLSRQLHMARPHHSLLYEDVRSFAEKGHTLISCYA